MDQNYDTLVVSVFAVLSLVTWLVLCQREHVKRTRARRCRAAQKETSW